MRWKGGESGMTLVELLVALGIAGVIMGVVAASLSQFLGATARGNDHLAVVHDQRDALYWLNRDAQMAVSALATVQPNSVTLNWVDPPPATPTQSVPAVGQRARPHADEERRNHPRSPSPASSIPPASTFRATATS